MPLHTSPSTSPRSRSGYGFTDLHAHASAHRSHHPLSDRGPCRSGVGGAVSGAAVTARPKFHGESRDSHASSHRMMDRTFNVVRRSSACRESGDPLGAPARVTLHARWKDAVSGRFGCATDDDLGDETTTPSPLGTMGRPGLGPRPRRPAADRHAPRDAAARRPPLLRFPRRILARRLGALTVDLVPDHGPWPRPAARSSARRLRRRALLAAPRSPAETRSLEAPACANRTVADRSSPAPSPAHPAACLERRPRASPVSRPS